MKSTPKFIPQSIVACYNNLHSLVIITNYKRLVLIHKYICFEILSISTEGFFQLSLNVTLCNATEFGKIGTLRFNDADDNENVKKNNRFN